MKLASKDPISLNELWHCTVHQATPNIGLGTKQRLREQAKSLLLASEFADDFPSHIQSSSLERSHFHLPVALHKTQEFIERITSINQPASLNQPASFTNASGFIAEKAFSDFIQSQLSEQIKKDFQLVRSNDMLTFQDDSYRVGVSRDIEQISFEYAFPANNFSHSSFMEVDLLFRLSHSGEYVAFDVTISTLKDFREEEREKKLTLLSQALGKNIILIDVLLTKKIGHPFYGKISDHLYRWHLPCKIDFHRLVLGIRFP